MNPVAQFPYVYFLGIGGIGMSALARWFRANGHQVWGYDKTRTPLTEKLEAEGIRVHYDDAPEQIAAEVRANKGQTLVVLTPAIPKDHKEWAWLKEQGYDIRKRSQVLGLLTAGRRTVAVAGTHGKTTTSSMVAHLLHHAGVPAGAFLGGISVNLCSNMLLPPTQEELATGNSHLTTDQVPIVVEADEYDRSFLTLHPDVAIVTSTDADHLDIYGEQSALVESFRQFVSQIRPGGTLLLNHTADPSVADAVQPGVRVIHYGLTPEQGAELHASALKPAGHQFHFTLHGPQGTVPGLQLAVPGFHNVENMLAAACAAQLVGLPTNKLAEAVAAYRGVKRRFEFVETKGHDHAYLDDYAHHPREIEAFLRSVRALYPGKRLRVVFQPHLYTRTRDFVAGFAQSLSLADEVFLLDIYPARELPIDGVSSELILHQLTAPRTALLSKTEVLEAAAADDNFDVLATVGAGDIDQLVPELKKILHRKWYGAEA
ncbi:UDP-N-acetylmuramate--L-alanine ligase [Hymenobacter busanensis]|uniref:UDP-N-acetylmuramate--L-alanine ligase n=1 Tax=Hymenobacter busanensis TaxID=2607656 RepID=A0A7L4ZW86_9BACT|nr:UDP-N-acetylmuramate--L-alanine ligase [Hymenobacter busanensis]KAA9339112.1 UDP-N-acetylmuramate--L-alanine ligase [Hymenobacter busanensis]QHJ07126.1 UDP-N-acetylmuramate--L-alanine ligase [Hymenobacter busanensis]